MASWAWWMALMMIANSQEEAVLQAHFAHPPREYGPVPIWWWSGEPLNLERLRWQMAQMRAGHVYNAIVLNLAPTGPLYGSDPDDPPFLSERWWALLRAVVEEAKAHGQRIWFYDQFGFSGAGLQTRLANAFPECRGWALERRVQEVRGPTSVDLTLPEEALFVAVVGVAVEGSVEPSFLPLALEPASRVTVPAGLWRVMTFFARPSGFDYLNPVSARRLLDTVHGEFERRLGEHLGTTIAGSFQDELPTLNSWTPHLPAVFQSRHGYDLRPLLPHLFEDFGPRSAQVRAAFFETAAHLAEEAFFKPLFQWHERHGMLCGYDQMPRHADPVDGQLFYLDYFRTQRWYQAPGNDQHGHAKAHSSLAHLYRRPRVWLEGFYNSGWGQTLEELAELIGRWYQQGSTLYNPHAFYYSTKGGWWEWAPPCTSFRQPYWAHYPLFADYVARLSYLLSQGVHVCDLAVLYPSTTVQGDIRLGQGAGKEARAVREVYWRLVRGLEATKVDYDILDEESVQRAQVQGGALAVSGERYRAVLLPRTTLLWANTLEQLLRFAAAGGVVVAVGPGPQATVERGPLPLATKEAMQRTFLWVEEPAAAVRLMAERFPPAVSGSVGWLHRRAAGREVFFLVRQEEMEPEVTFRAVGRAELWDPWTGGVRPLAALRTTATSTTLRVPLEAAPTAFVVFNPSVSPRRRLLPSPPRPSLKPLFFPRLWEVELVPTMDNRWGDFAWPPSPGPLPVECRVFRYRWEKEGEDGLAAGWATAPPEGPSWSRVAATFGPYWKVSPPLPADSSPPSGPGEDWGEAVYSLRYGIEKDPLHRHWLGPKGHVPSEFLLLEAAPAGRVRYLWTTVLSEREETVQVRVGAPGGKQLRLNGSVVLEEARGGVAMASATLQAGRNEVWLRLTYPSQGELRAFVQFAFPRHESIPRWIWGPQGAMRVFLRRTFEVKAVPSEAELTITADNGYKVWLNGVLVGQEEGYETFFWQQAETFSVASLLRPGRNVLAVEGTNLGGPAGICLRLRLGEETLVSDASWRATDAAPKGWQGLEFDDASWEPAEELGLLGMEPWGEIGNLSLPLPTLPEAGWLEAAPSPPGPSLIWDCAPKRAGRRGWYRAQTPPGTRRLWVEAYGSVRVFVAGKEFPLREGVAEVPPALQAESQPLALLITQAPGRYGGAAFKAPVRFEVGPGRMPLGSWHELGLPHYSGGLRYRQTLRLPPEFVGRRVWLDLGQVRGTAEVEVNGRKVGVRLWKPYRFEVTRFVQPGENTFAITVYNTLGPHFGSGAYPTPYVYPGQEVSGILGPVRLEAQGPPTLERNLKVR